MNLFPTNNFTVELRDNQSISMAELKRNTDITNSLISDWTKKEFRGQVNEQGFKIISSEIGSGAVCVFIGKFDGIYGQIEVKIHRAFKVMFSILLSSQLIGFTLIAYNEGIEQAFGFLPILLIGLGFIRFVFIELSFRIISKNGLNKLIRIIGIREIMKTQKKHQTSIGFY